jgi:hypothetical protein
MSLWKLKNHAQAKNFLTIMSSMFWLDVKIYTSYLDCYSSTAFQMKFTVSSQNIVCCLSHLDPMGYNIQTMVRASKYRHMPQTFSALHIIYKSCPF